MARAWDDPTDAPYEDVRFEGIQLSRREYICPACNGVYFERHEHGDES